MFEAIDFLGNKLAVGDKVIICRLHYREYEKCTITKINECKCTLINEKGRRIMQDHKQIIKLPMEFQEEELMFDQDSVGVYLNGLSKWFI